MTISNRVLQELRVYAESVIPGDKDTLDRFHRECTPERFLQLCEQHESFSGNDIVALQDRISELEDALYDAEAEAEDWEDRYHNLKEDQDE
jgi:hypothetical protein